MIPAQNTVDNLGTENARFGYWQIKFTAHAHAKRGDRL